MDHESKDPGTPNLLTEGSGVDLEALEAVARAATDGPWDVTGTTVWNTEYTPVCCGRGTDSCCGEAEYVAEQREIAHAGEANAAFIATFDPPTVLRLLSERRELLASLCEFMQDPLYQVAVGGNPNAVDRMLDRARAAISKAEARS